MTLVTITHYSAKCDLCERRYKYTPGSREDLERMLTRAGWTYGLREHWCGKCTQKQLGPLPAGTGIIVRPDENRGPA